MSTQGRRRHVWIAIGVLALLAVVIGLLWRTVQGPPPPPGGPVPRVPESAEALIPRATALRLIELRNLSLGSLENEDLAACDPLLLEIAETLPDEAFGPRNLSVARLLRLLQINETTEAPRHRAARQAALAAIEMLQRAEGQTALLHVLRSRIERSAAARGRQADEELEQAARLAPAEAWIQYELFQAGRFADDAAIRDRARKAISRAVELQPDNVWLLIELLPLQAEQQDRNIGLNLQRLADIVAPFASTIAAQTRIDPREYLNQARDAAADGNWPVVLQRVRVVSNVLKPDPLAQADKLRVDRHPLAFAAADFGPAFFARADLPPLEPAAPIPVRFAMTPDAPAISVENIADVQLADFDLDGRPDLFVTTAGRIEVFRRNEAGGWRSMAAATLPQGMTNLLLADLDDDVDANAAAPLNQSQQTSCRHADVDVIVWGPGGWSVLENRLDETAGTRTLAAVEQDADWQAIVQVRAAALVDIDHDGDLDIVAVADGGASVWSNRGNLTFENISERSALPIDASGVRALLPADWDRDFDLDVLLLGDGELALLENLRHGRVRYRKLDAAAAPTNITAWDFADLDNNQTWELIGAGDGGVVVQRTRVGPADGVATGTAETVDTEPVSRIITLDYDNDGFLDLIAASGARTTLYRGMGSGRFVPQPELSAMLPQSIGAFISGDIDGDGDLDLVIGDGAGVHMVTNEGGNANRWIDVAARAQQIKGTQASASGRVNHLGIGSTLTLRVDGNDQTRIVRSERTHFGLGERERPDVIRILWTNGIPQNVIRPPANGEICELQTLKGSCPYLYTWTGEGFEFHTDLLWASPLGLQFAEGVVAPWREWEYLKIPGDRLRERKGRYQLQITEELWEAAYFDEIRLFAIDHPADIEVFTNEKVGPAEIAAPMIHTVRQRRIPVAARDQRGRDVLPIVAAEDGTFLRGWERRIRQGLTEPHSLELDLGDLGAPRRITLFLTGWVYPSDTSINVALSQNPALDSPRPPFLETPDEIGQWREVLPFMGFPGGKTKSIAVDVSGLFANGDYRLRIGTTMEVYWDAVWFTADDVPGEFRETALELVAADLHFRGISRHTWGPDNQPETYHYDHVDPHVPWPPMQGAFTRYGDVAPLLAATDDRMIVMGAGDELTLEFAAPASSLPDGWARDFVIYNVGWDKDADLNTVYGQSTEPLPFREMTDYALRDGEARPVDAAYAEYLQTYQQRSAQRGQFWSELRGLPTE